MNVQNLKSGTATAARVQSSESAHWYQMDGTPAFEQPSADGKRMVKTTLAHARKLHLLPSVTTVLSELAKPQLVSWLIEQAVLAAVTTPRKEGETTDAFIHRVLQVEKQQDAERDAAAAFGTTVHNELENALKAGLRAIATGSDARVSTCVNAVLTLPLLQGRVVATESCVTGPGYAGKYDLEMDNCDEFLDLVDFKTARTMPSKDESFDDHILQLSAYAHARSLRGNLGSKRIRTHNIYISTREPGVVKAIENPGWEAAYEECFAPLVKVWQFRKQYRP